MTSLRPLFLTLPLWLSLQTLVWAQTPAPSATPSAPPTVDVVSPQLGDVTRYLNLPASVRAEQQVALYARVSGFLKTINVEVGDSVKAGQLLAELEVPELLADVERYKAEVEVAAAAAQRIEAARAKAPDLVMPASLDEARGRLRMAEAGLQRTQTLLGYARIVAPFDGTITLRNADPGAYVAVPTSGALASTAAVLSLANTASVRVVVAVPEVEATLVRSGLPVRITGDTLGTAAFKGKVSRFSGVLSEATRAMAVEIDLANPAGVLRPGMYVRAGLGLETHTGVLTVPLKAVLMEKTAASVFVVANGQLKKTSVTIGFNDGERSEIVSGLDANQQVVLLGKVPPVSGQAVFIREVK